MKEIFSLTVSALPDTIENKGEVIMNLLAGAPSLTNITPELGAKANTQVQLNILETSVNWSTGDCVNEDTSSGTTLFPRYIDVVRLTDREELCIDKLDAKLPMIMSAGARNEELPFANQFMELKVNMNSKQVEKLAWQGLLSSGATGNLATTEGWLKKASDEKSDLQYHAAYTAMTASNAIAIADQILANRSDEMFEMENFVVNLSLPDFSVLSKALIKEHGISGTGSLVDTGVENQAGVLSMVYPGTTVVFRGTHGLNGANAIFATPDSNRRYATDLEGDRER